MITCLDAIFNRELFSSLNTICALERGSAQLLLPTKRWPGCFDELKPAGPSLHSDFGTITVQVMQLQPRVYDYTWKSSRGSGSVTGMGAACVLVCCMMSAPRGEGQIIHPVNTWSSRPEGCMKSFKCRLSLVHVPHINPPECCVFSCSMLFRLSHLYRKDVKENFMSDVLQLNNET